MASIFNALNIGYSGLNASQIGINTTGHNISNAETEGYTRQRVIQTASTPLSLHPGDRGAGVTVDTIMRVFDTFVYDRYTKSAESKEYSDFTRETMETVSSYFPEIEDVGIKQDMHAYFDLWQDFASNPDNDAIKVALVNQAQTLASHINQTRDQVKTLQMEINDQLVTAVEEVNRIGAEIAEINLAIAHSEAATLNNANDLRDKRNMLELSLAKLLGSDVFGGEKMSDISVDRNVTELANHYNIHIEGHNLVDGIAFHPIGISNTENPEGFYDIFYERQDGVKIPFYDEIKGGKVGAILELRGSRLDESNGLPNDGTLQDIIDQLDSFAASLIESTNNIYAQSASQKMQAVVTDIAADFPIVNTDYNFNEGSFDITIYDIDGNEVATRTINITATTVMDDGEYAADGTVITPPSLNSIIGQFNQQQDDNADNNATNDIDDLVTAIFSKSGEISISINNPSSGMTFAIKDNLTGAGYQTGSNFAGAIGLQRFFNGTDAHNITVSDDYKEDPSQLRAFSKPADGNSDVALQMVQLQYEEVGFYGRIGDRADTLYGYFDSIATYVGSKTNSAIINNDAITAQHNAVEMEYFSISKVSIDEEMTNLIKYQTAYGASAKVITTIDQMINTLLGIKQ